MTSPLTHVASRGQQTRAAILTHAGLLATRIGLVGVTIGRLANDLEMSKSGLFAHFASKEDLQLRTLDNERDRFIEAVVRPALQKPGGAPRVREVFERWIIWRAARPGGCFFAAASFELDDRPGPVRERLAQTQREWLDALARMAEGAVSRGHFQPGIDAAAWAFELYGIMLSYHIAEQLLRDPEARSRLERAFGDLMERSQAGLHG